MFSIQKVLSIIILLKYFPAPCIHAFDYCPVSTNPSLEAATNSLRNGEWIKFISGASNQDLPNIRNLCYIYSTVGVNCIDLSADTAVLDAALDGIIAATKLRNARRPLTMISVNDDEDPHFRKAVFDVIHCPSSCSRPCEKVCPAQAIPPIKSNLRIDNNHEDKINQNGVIESKCYGCGRCIPICPYNLIDTQSYVTNPSHIISIIHNYPIDAIEIHTKGNNVQSFYDLWSVVGSDILSNLHIISLSFPELGTIDQTYEFLNKIFEIMKKNSNDWENFIKKGGIHIWQTDGRPMSGDKGRGATHVTANFAKKLLHHQNFHMDHPHSHEDMSNEIKSFKNKINFHTNQHYIQLAGGTNQYTKTLLHHEGLHQMKGFGGIAYGGYARKYISNELNLLNLMNPGAKIENYPEIFNKCYHFAKELI